MIEAVIWDFGGVFTTSPFEAFARYERERGLPKDLIRADQRRPITRQRLGAVRARRGRPRRLRRRSRRKRQHSAMTCAGRM